MGLEDGFIEFNMDGHTFILSQHKINLIYKNVGDLKDYWSLPIEPYDEYRIQPSNHAHKWRVSKISGYKLNYILNHVIEINKQLNSKYRLNKSTLSEVYDHIQGLSLKTKIEPNRLLGVENDLYPWQEEALEKWYTSEGKRGIVEAATGTGKTRLAFACMKKFYNDFPDGIVCIIVPRQPLFDQWQERLHECFPKIREDNYCYIGNGNADMVNRNTKIVIATQQAMILREDLGYGCELLKQLSESCRDNLIVVDEAHHLGAKQTLSRFVSHIPESVYTLGLTATPLRSDGVMDEVYRDFDCVTSDGPIYSYSLSRAVEDGVLTSVIQKNYMVSLNYNENKSHQNFCEQIKEIKKRINNSRVIKVDQNKINSGSIAYLVELERELVELQRRNTVICKQVWDLIKKIHILKNIYIKRRRLFNKAQDKWELLKSFLSEEYWIRQFTNGRWIFFHQEIEECMNTKNLLVGALGKEKIRLHHSGMMTEERQNVLVEFEKSIFNCLCAVQTLDEGLDIPDLTGIVIMSGSTSQRQQIQRCGRALRRTPNKDCAYLVSFLAQVDEDLTGEKLIIGPDNSTTKWTIEEYVYS
ncbi:hypothetical protein ASJ33_07740 [Dehalococcoides mccartyi]|uniref:DEAD/DEAH box helicase n=1 Tax=Dehalococcoides TaxID=61434 RepID=UPI0005B57B76|nr:MULTISPECIES: DEAD/DEAH box helicase family protein [Dehalococcoides]APH13054.1 hypothetical protein ASJ33_07740 [Dehalococcoides mccartyi]QYY57551.1 DEAD/DEAH box helicase family protein [Dehalococcoides mccartyi]BAQ35276.1 hypothetical protein UCH007_13180 [Dehalococcoides sp. UCH007]